MNPGTKLVYRTQEFAKLAGVIVRALYHYDRLDLLKPRQRTQAGYRLYTQADFGRLEQIVVLKFLGMPLKQIHRVLKAESNLGDALRRQLTVLAEKSRQINKAIQAISNAQESFHAHGGPDWKMFQIIVQEIEMQSNADWTRKYYSPEAQEKVEERKKLWSPELQERVSREWAQLFADVEAALSDDPASPKAQALASRWRKLIEEFTAGDREIQTGLNNMYADQGNWAQQTQHAYAIKPEIQTFISKAMRLGK